MKERILITGGAGFIGSHLVDELLGAGQEVAVLDDFSTGKQANLQEARKTGSVTVTTGSILSPSDIQAAMSGCGRVFHLAVQCVRRSLGNPVESHDVNATGTLNVLEAARQQGVRRFIYCSSSEVYGNSSDGLLNEKLTQCRPVTVYGAAKLAGEHYADAYRQTYGMETVVVRPFNAYGPRASETGTRAEVIPRFVVRALNGLPLVMFGDGANGRDFTYVAEIARGLMLAGFAPLHDQWPINIAYGRMVTIREVAHAVLRATGRNALAILAHASRPGDVYRLHADTARAASILGYRAEISFEDGLRRYIDWFEANRADAAAPLESDVENWTMPATGKVSS